MYSYHARLSSKSTNFFEPPFIVGIFRASQFLPEGVRINSGTAVFSPLPDLIGDPMMFIN